MLITFNLGTIQNLLERMASGKAKFDGKNFLPFVLLKEKDYSLQSDSR
jgi:hypothetical protein